MKIFITMICIAIATSIWQSKLKKAEKREKRYDEEIVKNYGEGTITLRNPNSKCMLFGIFQVMLVFFIAIIIGFIALLLYVEQYESNSLVWYLVICIPLYIIITIAKTMYKKRRVIITPKKIIIQSAYRKDRVVTYEEINQAAQFKKIKIKRDTLHIPTNKYSIKIKAIYIVPRNTANAREIELTEIAEIIELAEKTEQAIKEIKLRSRIIIPEFTDSRIKHMKLAIRSRAFIYLGFLFLLGALMAGCIDMENSEYINNLLTKRYCLVLWVVGIAALIIGKICFALGQYRLRKDINDSENVRIKL